MNLTFQNRGGEREQTRCDLLSRSMSQFAILIIAVGLFTNDASAQTPTATVRTIDGAQVTATVVDITVDQVKLKAGAEDRTVEVEQVESILFLDSASPKLPENSAKFQLLDGSYVFADKYKYVDRKIEATLTTGEVASISKRNISSIVFAGDRKTTQKQVDQIKQDSSIAADTLVVLRDEEFNAIEGIVRELDQDSVQFAIEDQANDIPISKLAAITFFKAGKNDFSAPLATCVLSDASRIRLRGFKVGTKQFILTSLTGDVFNVDFTQVFSLEFNSTVAVSLTDLVPSTNDWRPLLADIRLVEKLRQLRLARMDRSFNGEPLSLEFPRPAVDVAAGKARTTIRNFDSGIAIQGGGRLAWRLDGNYQSLSGLIGFSPRASEFGDVKVRMLIDGNIVFEKELNKNSMVEPEAFEIDLTNKRRMIIEVDYADGRSIGDVIHLVNLTLQK